MALKMSTLAEICDSFRTISLKQSTLRNCKTGKARGQTPVIDIHVIFSWAQIGRSAIFGREIGVPDREIFSRQKKSSLMSKIVYLHQRRSL